MTPHCGHSPNREDTGIRAPRFRRVAAVRFGSTAARFRLRLRVRVCRIRSVLVVPSISRTSHRGRDSRTVDAMDNRTRLPSRDDHLVQAGLPTYGGNRRMDEREVRVAGAI